MLAKKYDVPGSKRTGPTAFGLRAVLRGPAEQGRPGVWAFTVDESGASHFAWTGDQPANNGSLNGGVLRNVSCVTDPTN
jgi:hypothetical protein